VIIAPNISSENRRGLSRFVESSEQKGTVPLSADGFRIAPNSQLTDRLRGAARSCWDAIVVGAGPAGALAARQLARAGKSVLLVDKATFPRYKVCGCCLNATAAALLEQIGIGHVLRDLRAQPIDQLALATTGRSVTLPIPPGGFSVSREALDEALVREAISGGAEFLDGTRARLGDNADSADQRLVELSNGSSSVTAATNLVIAADGLRGSLLENCAEFPRVAARDSLIGVGAVLASAASHYRPGTVYMAVGKGGYVGQVRLEDGRLDVAAALDRRLIASASSPAKAALRIVEQAGFPWPEELSRLKWHGTPPLTRRLTRVEGRRLFVVGDAGAYVEPFTGEGMAWAMLTGCVVAPLACAAIESDSPRLGGQWEATHRRLLGQRMFVCRAISRLLRSPRMTGMAIATLEHLPWLATPIVRYLTAPRPSQFDRFTSGANAASTARNSST
jgi:menaquinone-9 beta-reductase